MTLLRLQFAIFASPTPLEIFVLALLRGGPKGAVKISSHCLRINKLDICIMKGCFTFSVLKN